MNTVYLILGGNKGNKLRKLERAIQLIETEIGVINKVSDIFETAAWGNTSQPDFLNQAVCVSTPLSAIHLLQRLLAIEKKLGRIRNHQKWMERTMDIDILFYNDAIIDTPDLKIPHPYLHERKFVLIPLLQLVPTFIHPLLNKSIETLLIECVDSLEVKPVNF